MKTLPIQSLELPGYDSYNRESYFKRFNTPAPIADIAKAGKSWIGSGLFYALKGIEVISITIPKNEDHVNIPGAGPFPQYVIAPTTSYYSINRGSINPLYLSLRESAVALMTALGGSSLLDMGDNSFNPITYTDSRKMWSFNMPKGTQVNAGFYINQRNFNGIGNPGHWDISTDTPKWVSTSQDELIVSPNLPPWPKPVRLLNSNEHIELSGSMSMPTLFIDDGSGNQDGNMVNIPSFTMGDRAMLADIHMWLKGMLGK